MDENRFDDLKEAYALGALSESEKREVEAYLVDNPERQAEMDDLAATASLLALSAEEQEPPTALRRNLMNIVEEETSSPPQRTETRDSIFTRLGEMFSLSRLATGAAVLAIVAGLLLWNSALRSEIQDLQSQPQGPKTYELQASGMAQGTSAKMVEVQEGQLILIARNLPSVPKGKAYEIWVIENGKPRPGSVFEPGDKTTTAPLGTYLKGGDVLAITVEPAEGSSQPTSTPILTTKL